MPGHSLWVGPGDNGPHPEGTSTVPGGAGGGVSSTVRGPARREGRRYLTIEDLISLSGMDRGVNLSVSHVDHGPDSDVGVVRVSMLEEWE